MKYYIQRGLSEYGPYTLAELQRYVAQGNILLADLCRGDGMTDWVPVSQVLGNIPVPAPAPVPEPAAGTVYGAPQATNPAYAGTPAYGATATPVTPGPVPPDFHWALVLVINFLCGLFRIVWLFIEASFVKKIRPDSNFLVFMIVGKCLQILSGVVGYAVIIAGAISRGGNEPPVLGFLLGFLGWTAGFVILYIGIFKMRDAIEQYYNTVEPINLRLSRVMTFFFPTFYFQHHFSRIARWKNTGYLEPQQ